MTRTATNNLPDGVTDHDVQCFDYATTYTEFGEHGATKEWGTWLSYDQFTNGEPKEDSKGAGLSRVLNDVRLGRQENLPGPLDLHSAPPSSSKEATVGGSLGSGAPQDRSLIVRLASGALIGIAAGITINLILNIPAQQGITYRQGLNIPSWATPTILLVGLVLGLALGRHDSRSRLGFFDGVVLCGQVGGLLTGAGVILGVLIFQLTDDDTVVEKVIVSILNGGFGGVGGAIVGAIFFGSAGIVYGVVRRIASAIVGTD